MWDCWTASAETEATVADAVGVAFASGRADALFSVPVLFGWRRRVVSRLRNRLPIALLVAFYAAQTVLLSVHHHPSHHPCAAHLVSHSQLASPCVQHGDARQRCGGRLADESSAPLQPLEDDRDCQICRHLFERTLIAASPPVPHQVDRVEPVVIPCIVAPATPALPAFDSRAPPA